MAEAQPLVVPEPAPGPNQRQTQLCITAPRPGARRAGPSTRSENRFPGVLPGVCGAQQGLLPKGRDGSRSRHRKKPPAGPPQNSPDNDRTKPGLPFENRLGRTTTRRHRGCALMISETVRTHPAGSQLSSSTKATISAAAACQPLARACVRPRRASCSTRKGAGALAGQTAFAASADLSVDALSTIRTSANVPTTVSCAARCSSVAGRRAAPWCVQMTTVTERFAGWPRAAGAADCASAAPGPAETSVTRP